MNKQDSIEYLTGFIMGVIPGIVLDYVGVALYRWVCNWLGYPPPNPSWWIMIPLPLLMGLAMAIEIANMHLSDY